MAFKLPGFTFDTSDSTGATGAILVNDDVNDGLRNFTVALDNGDETIIARDDDDAAAGATQREVLRCTWNETAKTLTPIGSPIESTNAGARIDWPSGTTNVYVPSAPAAGLWRDSAGGIKGGQGTSFRRAELIGSAAPAGVASVEFVTLIPAAAVAVELEQALVIPGSDNVDWQHRLADVGATWIAANYRYTGYTRDTSGTASGFNSTSNTHLVVCQGVGNATNEQGVSGKVKWSQPQAAKRTPAVWQVVHNNSADVETIGGGAQFGTLTMESLEAKFTGANTASGELRLWAVY